MSTAATMAGAWLVPIGITLASRRRQLACAALPHDFFSPKILLKLPDR